MLIANETPPTGFPVCFFALVERVREMSIKKMFYTRLGNKNVGLSAVLRKLSHSSLEVSTPNQRHDP